MSRFLSAAVSLIAVVAFAACSPAPVAPPASPSGNPASPSAPPTLAPTPSINPPPVALPPAPTPAPTAPPPVVTPRPVKPTPTPLAFTAKEHYLRDGIRRGATDCVPVRGKDNLPKNAIAGIECDSPERAVARIGYYLFANDDDMLAAYLWRMTSEGVELDTGGCWDGEGEGAYTPGEGMVLERNGCFINDKGFANYRATMPGWHVYIGILGRSADTRALENFAWRGNQDTPGNPTLWFEHS